MTEHKTLYAAMAQAFPELEAASKDANNPHFKTKYADLKSVVDAVKPALAKHGLWFAQVTHEQQGGVCVETIVCHESGENMSFGKLFVPASKQDAQGYGSALTYARRYSLQTAFGIPSEDDDGNAAVKSAPQPAQEPARLPNKITDDQRDILAELIPAAGLTLQDVCAGYKIASLKDLPSAQFDKVRNRLSTLIGEKKDAA